MLCSLSLADNKLSGAFPWARHDAAFGRACTVAALSDAPACVRVSLCRLHPVRVRPIVGAYYVLLDPQQAQRYVWRRYNRHTLDSVRLT